MSAIETLRAYRTLHNADNVDDAIEEIQRSYKQLEEQAEEIDLLRAENAELRKLIADQPDYEIEIESLQDENAELREWITKMANEPTIAAWGGGDIARAFLAKTAKEGK